MDPYLPFAPMNGGGGQNVQHRYSTDSAQDGHNGRNPHPEMNGTAPLPMAAPARSYGGMGGDMPGLSQAGLPRSPPKNKSEYTPLHGSSHRTEMATRYAARALQILLYEPVSGRSNLPFLARSRVH